MSKASEHAYEIIRSQIVAGTLEPGAQIKEEEIAQLCGVSRTPVRDALRRLEAEMFIRRTDSQRSYVAEWSLEDIEDVYMLRALLEARASSLAVQRAPREIREALLENCAEMAKVVNRPDPDIDSFLRVNGDFHRLIIEGAASERLSSILNRLILVPLIDRTARRYNQADLKRSLADHLEITAAISCRDADWASSLMTAHIRRAYHVFVGHVDGGMEVPSRD